MKVDILFTTFPLLSETFYQREVRALRAQGADVAVYSLWGGEAEFDGQPVHLFSKWRLLLLPFWILYWLIRRPGPMLRLLARLFGSLPGSGLNVLETLLGLGFGLCHAHQFSDSTRVLHAAWATAPGTAAQLIAALNRRHFCQGAHAYDVFRDGGDWWLTAKLRAARLIVTSTESTGRELVRRGAEPDKVQVIRRGLADFPPLSPPRGAREPLRLLTVGRLIEKKGYFKQFQIYEALLQAGVSFEARIVGEGPLMEALENERLARGLQGHVELLGALPHHETMTWFAWADVFIYTGEVAASGDRDGLPNVVPEAMLNGLPVVSTPVAGVPEAVVDRETGVLLDSDSPSIWVEELERLRVDDNWYNHLREGGRGWVESEFDAARNAGKLLAAWQQTLKD